VQISRKIGTYDISIQPFEDCCTVFTPRHPRTKPKLNFVELAESNFDFTKLLEEAVEGTEQISIG
jgi:thiamine biosynthesis protein ThiI